LVTAARHCGNPRHVARGNNGYEVPGAAANRMIGKRDPQQFVWLRHAERILRPSAING
jgi:hypothetical protein